MAELEAQFLISKMAEPEIRLLASKMAELQVHLLVRKVERPEYRLLVSLMVEVLLLYLDIQLSNTLHTASDRFVSTGWFHLVGTFHKDCNQEITCLCIEIFDNFSISQYERPLKTEKKAFDHLLISVSVPEISAGSKSRKS